MKGKRSSQFESSVLEITSKMREREKLELTLNRSGRILVHPLDLLQLLPLSFSGCLSESVSRDLRSSRSGGSLRFEGVLLLLESSEGVSVVLSTVGSSTVGSGSGGGFLRKDKK